MTSLVRASDLSFLLFDWLDIEAVLESSRFSDHDRTTIEALLSLSERLAADRFLPLFKPSDVQEPYLEDGQVRILSGIGDALRDYAEAGLFAASFAPEAGGMNLPFCASSASFSIFASASFATASYTMLTTANARLITAFGSPAQFQAFARPQIDGSWWGTMCLSEPQAGSNLGEVRTRAAADGEDDLGRRYRLFGNKMWISGGDQDASENIVHLVLAKVARPGAPLPAGTAGLSLFVVPKILPGGERNDISVAGLNHKMGWRGTSNCLLNFGEGDGAIGWLIGREGDGLKQMFMMMNEARIGVGICAASVAYRASRLSVEYARERQQGPAGEEGDQPAIIRHPDVRRMLLAQKSYAEGALALCLFAARLIDAGDPDSEKLVALLTPVVKSWPSEYGLLANDIAIQIHGGYGYTRDFDVEQLYRDNRLNPIHEGTTGIQAIDLLSRKILRDTGAMDVLRLRIADTLGRARGGESRLSALATDLERAWTSIDEALRQLRTFSQAHLLEQATPFLSAFGHAVVAWLWLDQAIAAERGLAAGDAGHTALLKGKVAACDYFFAHELAKLDGWLRPILNGARLPSCADEEF